MELLNAKGAKGSGAVPVTMTLAKQESQQDVDAKKSMLGAPHLPFTKCLLLFCDLPAAVLVARNARPVPTLSPLNTCARTVEDMKSKGQLQQGQKVSWTVRVDPSIQGGVVYTIGDLLVDASVRSLQAQFFQSLDQAGLKRVM